MKAANRRPTAKRLLMMISAMRVGDMLLEELSEVPLFICGDSNEAGDAAADLDCIPAEMVRVGFMAALTFADVGAETLTPGGAFPETIGWCCKIG